MDNQQWAPRALSLLRIIAAFMMLQHGAQKLFGVLTPPPAPASLRRHNLNYGAEASYPEG